MMTDTGKKTFDVAVIGAGPMGSFAADRMAGAGLQVLLLEKASTPGASTVCAGAMLKDAVRFADIPESIIEKAFSLLRLNGPKGVREWRFPQPYCFTVERQCLDEFMAKRATESGATLLTGARVIDVNPDEGTLKWQQEQEDGSAKASVIIFADGPQSYAHNFAEVRGHIRCSQGTALQFDIEAPDNTFSALEIQLDPIQLPFGYGWIFPKKHHLSVGVGQLGSTAQASLNIWLKNFIHERPELRNHKVLRRAGGIIPICVKPLLPARNCLAIGDAAGMVNPLTGGGYICGFQSAACAADACIAAFQQGQFSVRRLRHYPQRMKTGRQYFVLLAANRILRGMVAVYRLSGKTLYPAILRIFLESVHYAGRLGIHAMWSRFQP